MLSRYGKRRLGSRVAEYYLDVADVQKGRGSSFLIKASVWGSGLWSYAMSISAIILLINSSLSYKRDGVWTKPVKRHAA